MKRLGCIGCGRMATAIIKGFLGSGFKSEDVLVVDQTPELTAQKANFLGVQSSTLLEIIQNCDLILLCIKPQQARSFFQTLPVDRGSAVWVSVMAGISLTQLSQSLGKDMCISRVMPNTPAFVSKGMSAVSFSSTCSDADRETVKSIFNTIGDVVEVNDDQMHAVTALSGSGPAFFLRISQIFIKQGIDAGLSDSLATKLVLQTQLGSAYLALNSSESLMDHIQSVSSPGGTTLAGLSVFDETSLEKDLQSVIESASKRSKELSEEVEI